MPLYHCTHRSLADQSIIEPGNWGRIILQTGTQHPCWKREIALEAVRVWNHPEKPSRLNSGFACETIETIQAYQSAHCKNGFIYEFDITDKSAAIHKGDFNAVEPLSGLSDDIWSIAEKYWCYQIKTSVETWPKVECSEILTAAALRVVKRVIELEPPASAP